jgi:hypothetical protein
MTVFGPQTQLADCPECHGRNVLVVAATATAASLYCLACEHLFAASIAQAQQHPRPPPARADDNFRPTPGR